MISPLTLLKLLVGQVLLRQKLVRAPEPFAVTEDPENVAQYDRILTSKLVITYALAWEILHRLGVECGRRSALDLACGPGHFTLGLARYLGFNQVTGLDLSPLMVKTASHNARLQQLDGIVSFKSGDVTCLDDVADDSLDLVCFNNGAHHLHDLDTVGHVLRQMDRITHPLGIVFVMDLVRLRTAKLTDIFVRTVGRDYRTQGLERLYDEFHASMYAAWTLAELRAAIPSDQRRTWYHLVPPGLPIVQICLGVKGRLGLFRKNGPWRKLEQLVPQSMRGDYRLLRWLICRGVKRVA